MRRLTNALVDGVLPEATGTALSRSATGCCLNCSTAAGCASAKRWG